MHKVIKRNIQEKIVFLDEVKKDKLYLMKTYGEFCILKKCNPIGHYGEKWAWLSLMQPDRFIGVTFNGFYEAIKYGIDFHEVYEINNIYDLADALQNIK